MPKIELRHQRVSDAKRYFEILNNPNFIYFSSKPKTIEDQKAYLRKNPKKERDHFQYNFAIIYNKALVGGCGIKINQHRTYIGEIGYFIDEPYWGRGIATEAVSQLERIGFGKLGLVRMEIWINVLNKASENVAIKSGYSKEGVMRKAHKYEHGYADEYLYAKVK